MPGEAIAPFLCDSIDKSSLQSEWKKWLQSVILHLQQEGIEDPSKKRNKLLYLGGGQLKWVIYKDIYRTPDAIVQPTQGVESKDVFTTLIDKLTNYFTPAYQRHVFRSLKPEIEESLDEFLTRLRNQAAKCLFEKTGKDIVDIHIKDKLIDAWAPKELQKLLLERDYDLKEVVQLCYEYETHRIAVSSETAKIDKLTLEERMKIQRKKCIRCGECGHSGRSPYCSAKDSHCAKCGFYGHFTWRCKTKSRKRKAGYFGQINTKRPRKPRPSLRFVMRDVDVDVEKEWKQYKKTDDLK